jgi:adenylate cyclase class 2
MEIEYEAAFADVDKEAMREKLRAVGATLVRAEFLQKRTNFTLPAGSAVEHIGWARVRDEGNRITMSIKTNAGERIEDQREICLTVEDFEQAETFLLTLGCRQKSYQETKRELWTLDGAEITIDTWPFLEPFVEVEAKSEAIVRAVSEKLGFDYAQAIFGPVDAVCRHQYPRLTAEYINNRIPRIVFDGENPFSD